MSEKIPKLLQTSIEEQGPQRNIFYKQLQVASNRLSIGGYFIIRFDNTGTNLTRSFRKQYAFIKYLPPSVEILPAIDGKQIDLLNFLYTNKLSRKTYNQLVSQDRPINDQYLTLERLGRYESHVHAWQRVLQVKKPILVLEDDVYLDEELFDYSLPSLVHSLPTDFSLLYFPNPISKIIESKIINYNDFLWKVKEVNWSTSYAYLISPKGAATLIKFIYPVEVEIDSTIINIIQSKSLNVFMSKRILVETNNTNHRASDVQRSRALALVIPRIFHFIWYNNNTLPIAAQENIKLWKKFHPNWQIQLWTSESVVAKNLTIYNKHLLYKL